MGGEDEKEIFTWHLEPWNVTGRCVNPGTSTFSLRLSTFRIPSVCDLWGVPHFLCFFVFPFLKWEWCESLLP